MYELLGISLVLAALLTINAFASLVIAAGWRLLKGATRNLSAGTRANLLFTLRVSPPALAIICVAAFLVPSFLTYEPYSTAEVVSKKLGALALVSAIGVAFALWRGVRSWWATRTLLKRWLAISAPIELARVNIPTFRIQHPFPIIAVVGTWTPRLFIAGQVLDKLSEEELSAAIAHECGHLAARDNLKRSLLRACRDSLMIVPCGRSLDRAWAEMAECAADENAAQKSPATALELASALVKIARMIPAGAHAAIPVAVFLVGNEDARGVKARVSRLLEIASNGGLRHVTHSTLTRVLSLASLGLLFAVGALAASSAQVLVTVHSLIEHAVRILS
ncbi:MAG: M48 family metalloprotease [Acidobacteriota bacterium]